MKKAFDNDQAVGDEVKYESLLLDHLQLQKELVSKKRKLYKEKQKRDTLLAEVRFLRQRHKHLLQIRSVEFKDDTNQAHDANAESRILLKSERSCNVDDAPSCNTNSVSLSNHDPMSVEGKLEKLFVNCRRGGKRKISWPNKMSLEAIKEEDEEEQEEKIGHELLKMEKLANCWTDKRIDQIRCL